MPLIALPGMMEMLLIFGVVVLLFGAKKLPQLGGAIGESIKNFKKGVRDPEVRDPGGTGELGSAEKKPDDTGPKV